DRARGEGRGIHSLILPAAFQASASASRATSRAGTEHSLATSNTRSDSALTEKAFPPRVPHLTGTSHRLPDRSIVTIRVSLSATNLWMLGMQRTPRVPVSSARATESRAESPGKQ